MRDELIALTCDLLRPRFENQKPNRKPEKYETVLDASTRLMRHDAFLDSLGLVELLFDLEMEIEKRYQVKLELTDIDCFEHPYRNVGTLADFMIYKIRKAQASLDWLIARMRANGKREAIAGQCTHAELAHRFAQRAELDIAKHQVVIVEADYSEASIVLLLSLIANQNIIVPLTPQSAVSRDTCASVTRAQWLYAQDDGGRLVKHKLDGDGTHPLYSELNGAGLVLFSSGTTGEPKAALHDLGKLLAKFRTVRPSVCAVSFLLFDHIGGWNTLFAALSTGGCVVIPEGRGADSVCAAIEKHHAEILPTSPSFLNLLLLDGAHERHDLSSLKVITYGTELMPAQTLKRIRAELPHVELRQTYGLSEVGILRAKSESSDSLWLKVGGEGYETKIENGTLYIRAASRMLGYLNAPSPFDAEGWLDTGDLVEARDDGYIRFIGRRDEIINVGGQKVRPVEVESVILSMPNVADCVVTGERNPLVGCVVAVRVQLQNAEDAMTLRARLRAYCAERLESYKVPAKIEIVDAPLYGARFKRVRK